MLKETELVKLLLVEDDQAVRRMYSTLFKREGFEVIEATNGQEAIEAAAQIPDIILLDIMMPVMNGIEALRQIKANAKTHDIPVIMLTNLAEDKKTKESIELGAESYIIKSNQDPLEIAQLVRGMLDKPKG